MIVKLHWKPKKSTEATFAVDVPDIFTQAFVMEKDSKRFPTTGGWGYGCSTMTPRLTPSPQMRPLLTAAAHAMCR
jgi:hypothetical protein